MLLNIKVANCRQCAGKWSKGRCVTTSRFTILGVKIVSVVGELKAAALITTHGVVASGHVGRRTQGRIFENTVLTKVVYFLTSRWSMVITALNTDFQIRDGRATLTSAWGGNIYLGALESHVGVRRGVAGVTSHKAASNFASRHSWDHDKSRQSSRKNREAHFGEELRWCYKSEWKWLWSMARVIVNVDFRGNGTFYIPNWYILGNEFVVRTSSLILTMK